ncbi:hypothetical protein CALVIDRAFT_569925 [Calocera viscosa TUFC12733]|uniref:Uncharacterized protein n=1 Tax=Calocera viscosa (strain TUFC12733) TaxID=1330018 RepID=A0A167FF87_CALVF|nr:hypothetical protein CALVIDRAFT_569925 [Calocera viscosa TUFC12733]
MCGEVPDLASASKEKHIWYQAWVGEVYSTVWNLLNDMGEPFWSGTVFGRLLQDSLHARQTMCLFDLDISQTILSNHATPCSLKQWALGRTPMLWHDMHGKLRHKIKDTKWWNVSMEPLQEMLVKEVDRLCGKSALSWIMTEYKWEGRPNIIAVQIYMTQVLDPWLTYIISCFLAGVKPSILMKKNMQLMFKQLHALLAYDPKIQLPVPLNILDPDALPADLLGRCPNVPAFNLLDGEVLKQGVWAKKIQNAAQRYEIENDIEPACESLGLLYASFEAEALEGLAHAINSSAMRLMHSLRSILEKEEFFDLMSPHIMNIPPYIRQRWTESYHFSDKDQLEESRRYLSRDHLSQQQRLSPARSQLPPASLEIIARNRQGNEDSGGRGSEEDQERPIKRKYSSMLEQTMQTKDTERRLSERSRHSRNSSSREESTADVVAVPDRPQVREPEPEQMPVQKQQQQQQQQQQQEPEQEPDPEPDPERESARESEGGSEGGSEADAEPMRPPEPTNEPATKRRRIPQRNVSKTKPKHNQPSASRQTKGKGRGKARAQRQAVDRTPVLSDDVDVEEDPERLKHDYYQGNEFETRIIFSLPAAQSEQKLRSWRPEDGYDIGERIVAKKWKAGTTNIAAEIRRIGSIEMTWQGEEPTTVSVDDFGEKFQLTGRCM